jgi:hypothetical protein
MMHGQQNINSHNINKVFITVKHNFVLYWK